MKRKVLAILILVAMLGMSFNIAAAGNGGGNVFKKEPSTVNGFETWDSDMINIEAVDQTGAGVYVAVLDTGLAPNWKDYFPSERVATELGTGFNQPISFKSHQEDPCGYEVEVGELHQTSWVGSTGSTHGTHVASTILGYFYRSNYDMLAGFPIPAIQVRGIAPEVTVIPVKVLTDYQVPALPKCDDPGPLPSEKVVFGTDAMVAAGINYVTDLAIAGYRPMVINMSLGGSELAQSEQDAIDRAVENGVIVVASAGNEGEEGMGFPGAYPPVISAGSVGWTGEWVDPGTGEPYYRMWWLKEPIPPLEVGSGDVADPTSIDDVYLSDFSSRALPGQELDVLAPGSWVRGPYPGTPGYSHLPWWSKGIGDIAGWNPGNFYYVGGTSMAAPHVSAVSALLLQKNPSLEQGEVEALLKSSALPMPDTGSRDIFEFTEPLTVSWDNNCDGTACDPVGAGLLQADAAIAAAPPLKFSVVSTNDFHGALIGRVHSWSHGDMVGSADYLAGYINIVRQENPGATLYLDAGDAMQGTLISNIFDGKSTIEAFNQMGVAAMAIGNHEFDWGQDVLAARLADADFPFLAANIVYNEAAPSKQMVGERPAWATPYILKDIMGTKVGIIGIANPETPSITNPLNVADLDFTDAPAAVDEFVDDVETAGANLVIVLAHIGGYWPDFGELADFVCDLDPEKIDLVVSGHSHARVDDVICGIPVIQAYSSGTAFARVDFEVDTLTGEAISYEMNYSPTSTYNTYYSSPATYRRWDTGVWQQVVPDPEVTAIVAAYQAMVDPIQNEVIGETTAAITRDYRYESVMGDWVTDIMRAADPDIDFAFTNSGGLREDIDAGEITYGEVYTALPFDNTNVIVELTGAEIFQVLEEGITGDHGVIQVSGLRFAFDYDAPALSRITGDVVDLSTGLPLEAATVYQVAVNDFMAAGGDGYATLGAAPKVDTFIVVRDLVEDWVRANSPFTPPDPTVEQRITITGTPPS